jgi:LAO/AO transport system kinase
MKRGIMEHSHLVVVNKADGDLLEAAMRMQYEYMSSLKFMRPVSPNWRSKVSFHSSFSDFHLIEFLICLLKVLKVSSLTKAGIPEMWDVMQEFHKKMIDNGELLETRRKQQTIWMWNHITSHVLQVLN